MAYLNINIPPIECYIRSNFLRNEPDATDGVEFLPCIIFGMASIPGRSPLFHFIMEDEGLWWRMPIHAFAWKPGAPQEELSDLVLWDSFSYHPSVTTFSLLAGNRMGYRSRAGEWCWGNYVTTLDWAAPEGTDLGFSETPNQHKCGHIIQLDSGNYAIQPNNRCRMFTPFFTTKPYGSAAKRVINTHVWTVEDTSKWKVSDDNRFNYDTIENDDSNSV